MITRKRLILAALQASAAILAGNPSTWAQTPADSRVVRAKAQAPAKGGKPAAESNAPPPRQKPDPAAVEKMEKLLREWEDVSAGMQSLSAKYERVDNSALFKVKRTYQGQAFLRSPNLAYLDFYEIKEGAGVKEGARVKEGANSLVFDERIVCDGKKVYQFKGPTKQVFIFPLARDERQKALDEGPLPFLFNMKVDKAKLRYDMALVGEDASSYYIQIVPRLSIDREEYSQAWIKLEKKRFLPTAIRLWSPEGKDTKTFTFKPENLVVNGTIKADYFDGQNMVYGPEGRKKAKWDVIINPGGSGSPAPGNAAAPAAGRPVGQPAMRPSNPRK